MKKLLFLSLVAFLSSCACVLSQVPPQTLYVNQNCEGILPDYRTKVLVSDNCPSGYVLTQTPVPGTVLTVLNPSATVVITARDAFGNISLPLNIPVTLVDTIKPILSWPIGQANMTDQDAVYLWQNWVAAIKVHGIAKWMYDRKWTQGLVFAESYTDSCGVVHPLHVEDNLKYFTNVIKLTDEEYAQYVNYVAGK